jgi:hypothetical protein
LLGVGGERNDATGRKHQRDHVGDFHDAPPVFALLPARTTKSTPAAPRR